jgi:hypothetical protein
MLDSTSLALTLDAVNEALLWGRPIGKHNRLAVARWIAGRCGEPGSYESMPAPTETDFAAPAALFTGEPLTTGAGTACKLGHEACRVLLLLQAENAAVRTALARAEEQMTARLEPPDSARSGRYCCGSCSVAYWRHLLAGGLDHPEARLANGLEHLARSRQGNGRWRTFPSWYTVLTLLEADLPTARAELQYAAPVLERSLTRPSRLPEAVARRREEIARQALAKI